MLCLLVTLIKQNLLYDEDGNGLAKLGARLHNSEAKRDYLRSQEEVDHFRGVVLDQGTNDSEASEAQILEGS